MSSGNSSLPELQRELPEEQQKVPEDEQGKTESEKLLANLNEEQKQAVQMQKMSEVTVRPGLLRLPVHRVVTAKNSEQYAIELDHPVLDTKEFRFYVEKPTKGWSSNEELPKLMDAYGINSTNPYHLQLHHMYVEYDESEDEWELRGPPSPYWKKYRRTKKAIKAAAPRRIQKVASFFLFLYGAMKHRGRQATKEGYSGLAFWSMLGAGIAIYITNVWLLQSPLIGSLGIFSTAFAPILIGFIGAIVGAVLALFIVTPPGD